MELLGLHATVRFEVSLAAQSTDLTCPFDPNRTLAPLQDSTVDLQKVRIKSSSLLKRYQIEHSQAFVARLNEFIGAKPLKGSVGMNCGQAHGIGDLCLRQRKIEPAALHQANQAQPVMNFAEQVRDALVCVTTAKVHNPGTEGCFLDERGPPERLL